MPVISRKQMGMYRGRRLQKAVPPAPRARRKDKWGLQLEKLNDYRMGEEWAEKCRQVKDRDDHQCVICASMKNLEVHHLTYCNVFEEPLHHLVTVCQKCHIGKSGSIHYDENGKRRKKWKKYNPKPVLPKGENDESTES